MIFPFRTAASACIRLLLIGVMIASLTSCGAGSGDPSASSTPRCYYAADFTPLTSTNALAFAGMALIGHNQPATIPFDAIGIARHIADQVSATPTTDGYSSAGGEVTVSSQVSGTTGLGVMSVSFNQYLNGGITLDGVIEVQINGVDPYSVSNDKTMTLSGLVVTGLNGSVTMNGTLREVNGFTGTSNDPSSDLTLNISAIDATGHEIEMIDYTYKTAHNSYDGLLYSEQYGGKIFDSIHGCAFVQNTSLSSQTLIVVSLNPQVSRYDTVRSGIMSLGFNGRARATLSTNAASLIEVDTTGDGVFDYSFSTTLNAI